MLQWYQCGNKKSKLQDDSTEKDKKKKKEKKEKKPKGPGCVQVNTQGLDVVNRDVNDINAEINVSFFYSAMNILQYMPIFPHKDKISKEEAIVFKSNL